MSVWTTLVSALVYMKVFAFLDFDKCASAVRTEECGFPLGTRWCSLKATYPALDLVVGFIS
jgi:hypothetical protein